MFKYLPLRRVHRDRFFTDFGGFKPIPIYDVNKKTDGKSDLIMFYEGNKVDCCDHLIEHFYNFNSQDMEAHHDFIQWMFPNKEQSMYNVSAPIMTDEDIEYFKNSESLLTKVGHMNILFMKHLGFTQRLTASGNVWYESSPYTRYFMLGEFNHNHLRVTRMIKFLKHISHKELQAVFTAVYNNCAVDDSKKYWSEAYNG